MSVQTWENILKQIEQESDAAKIAELAKKLNDAGDRSERESETTSRTTPRRSGCSGAEPPCSVIRLTGPQVSCRAERPSLQK